MISRRMKYNNNIVIENNIESTNILWDVHNSGNDNIVNVNKDEFVNLLLLKKMMVLIR